MESCVLFIVSQYCVKETWEWHKDFKNGGRIASDRKRGGPLSDLQNRLSELRVHCGLEINARMVQVAHLRLSSTNTMVKERLWCHYLWEIGCRKCSPANMKKERNVVFWTAIEKMDMWCFRYSLGVPWHGYPTQGSRRTAVNALTSFFLHIQKEKRKINQDRRCEFTLLWTGDSQATIYYACGAKKLAHLYDGGS